MRSASRITGTISPPSVSAAKPMWQYFLSTRASPSSDALKWGNARSAAAHAFTSSATMVTFTPSWACAALTSLRKASSAVMSASSNCVTCGIIAQLRASAGPAMRAMRESGSRSTGPKAAKLTCGHAGRPAGAEGAAPGAALPVAGAAAGAPPPFAAAVHVLAGDAALVSRARDRGEVDAQLAGERPGARAGVDRRRATAAAIRRRRGRRPLHRCRLRLLAAGGRRVGGGPRIGLAALLFDGLRRRRLPGLRLGLHRRLRLLGGLRRGLGLAAARGGVGGEREDQVALGDLVAHRDRHLAHHAGGRRGDLHAGLVRLEDDQRVLRGDGVARRDQHLDDGDGVEVADVGDADLCQRCHGGMASGSISYRVIAAAAMAASMAPSRARAARAEAVTW